MGCTHPYGMYPPIWDVTTHNVVFCRYFMTPVRSTNKKMTITKLAECSVLLMTLHTILGVLFFVIIKQNLDIMTNKHIKFNGASYRRSP